MKATFALLFDHEVHNVVRNLVVELHQNYHTGLVGSQLPPHVSLKQPFPIADLRAVEAYFDRLARSIDPIGLTFYRIGASSDAPVLWLEVQEIEALRHLHNRINLELSEHFPNTQAPFDGPAYHFHLTLALGAPLSSVFQTVAAEIASNEVTLRTIARHIVMFYYDDDNFSLGSFVTYKILPLGMLNEPVGTEVSGCC